jgi:hypothetical protein
MAAIDTVYHCSGCPCGSGGRPMSIADYLRDCFFVLNTESKGMADIRRTINYQPVMVKKAKRKDFIDPSLKSWGDGNHTRINDGEYRYPILCDIAFSKWDPQNFNDEINPENRKVPSSMNVIFGQSKSKLLHSIRNGERLGSPYFKHWNGEGPICSCDGEFSTTDTSRRLRQHIDQSQKKETLLLVEKEDGNFIFGKKIAGSSDSAPKIDYKINPREYPDPNTPSLFIKSIGDDLTKGQFSYVERNQKISLGANGTGRLFLPLTAEEWRQTDVYIPERYKDWDAKFHPCCEEEDTEWHVDNSPWEDNCQGIIFKLKWTIETRSSMQKIIQHFFDIKTQNQRAVERVIIEAYNEHNEIFNTKEIPYTPSKTTFRITRFGGRPLNSFTIKFSNGITFTQDSIQKANQSSIKIEDLTAGNENPMYKIMTYDAKEKILKAMFEFELNKTLDEPGWIEVCCYNHNDPLSAGSYIRLGVE